MATLVTRSGKGSPLTHAEVDANFTNLNTDKLELSGGTMTGNLSFGDNDKAIFGAGSDLQIYHDGSNSYVDEQGTGNLFIRGTNHVYLQNSAGTKTYFAGNDPSGWVRLYHNNNKKFETTSTGIDVTGTVTADGLTVQTTNGLNAVLEGTTSYQYLQFKNSGETENYLGFVNDNFTVTAGNTERMRITSAGNVGIGTSSPAKQLHIESSTGGTLRLSSSDTSVGAGESLGQIDWYSNDASGSGSGVRAFVNVVENDGGLGRAYDMTFGTGQVATATERMRIDSSGNVGIGVSDPSSYYAENLVVKAPAEGGITIRSNATTDTNYLMFADGTAGTAAYRGYIGYTHNSPEVLGIVSYGYMRFYTGEPATERMRIDSSGNVGIGTSSVGYTDTNRNTLQVNGSTSSIIALAYGGTNAGYMYADSSLTQLWSEGTREFNLGTASAGPITFKTNNTERMRIDSSGNVLVGHTSAYSPINNGGDGVTLSANGEIFAGSSQSSGVMLLNRENSDGNILTFRKDGTTVGSIGSTGSGTQPYFVKSSTGGFKIGNDGSTALILPVNADGSNSDGGAQLGVSTNRFKDLYLSGGVYLGGTGAANKLDDVETGTFTPTVFGATTAGTTVYGQQQGFYEKVGNVVNVMIGLSITSMSGTGSIKIGGLPFAAKNAAGYEANGSVMYTSFNIGSYTQLCPYIPLNTAVMDLFISSSNQVWTLAQAQGNWAMRITITYQV